MIVAIFHSYLVLLFLLVHFGIVPSTCSGRLHPPSCWCCSAVRAADPDGLGRAAGPALVVRNSVAIVPDVAAEVTDVPVEGQQAAEGGGGELFRIHPTPFDAQVKAIKAQLKLSETRLSQMTQLFERDFGLRIRRRAEAVRGRPAQGATRGRAVEFGQDGRARTADGYATNWPCEKARASRTCRSRRHGVHRHDGYAHRRRDCAERRALCAARAGRRNHVQGECPAGSYAAKVESILQAVATGQVQTSGLAVAPKAVQSLPFVVRIKLDDAEFARALPAGAPAKPRSLPIGSRRPTSSEKCCCGKWRSSITSIRSRLGRSIESGR